MKISKPDSSYLFKISSAADLDFVNYLIFANVLTRDQEIQILLSTPNVTDLF